MWRRIAFWLPDPSPHHHLNGDLNATGGGVPPYPLAQDAIQPLQLTLPILDPDSGGLQGGKEKPPLWWLLNNRLIPRVGKEFPTLKKKLSREIVSHKKYFSKELLKRSTSFESGFPDSTSFKSRLESLTLLVPKTLPSRRGRGKKTKNMNSQKKKSLSHAMLLFWVFEDCLSLLTWKQGRTNHPPDKLQAKRLHNHESKLPLFDLFPPQIDFSCVLSLREQQN